MTDTVCHKCHYINLRKQMSPFGECLYFRVLKQEPKDIPLDVFEKGCQHFKPDNIQKHPLMGQVIKTFEGTLI